MLHPMNFTAGWILILLGFLSGAAIGLFFHRDNFLGGYGSFPRRLLRLGHIALVALGALNVLYSVSVPATRWSQYSSICILCGGVLMPSICFLAAWRKPARNLFFVPVTSLLAGVLLILMGGSR